MIHFSLCKDHIIGTQILFQTMNFSCAGNILAGLEQPAKIQQLNASAKTLEGVTVRRLVGDLLPPNTCTQCVFNFSNFIPGVVAVCAMGILLLTRVARP